MILIKKLESQGWYFTDSGIKKLITINNLESEDVNKIISLALDWDLRDIAAGALPSKLDSNGTIPGRIVLQLQKMRNISAPKGNEESSTAPRFLQLELSDGVNTIGALEFEHIANLNLNVPPGTKLFIKTEKLKLFNGFLVLKASDIQVLGGKVEALVEKWELARQMLKYARSNRRLSGSAGPPPWIAFGKRFDALKDALSADKNFKSLQAANEKDKNSKENDEFNASRSQAIAAAAKAGNKKVFGGGQQNILDHNVKKILEKGYSEEQAKQALKSTNNNLERALYNLKRKNNMKRSPLDNSTQPVSTSVGGRLRDRGIIASAKEETATSKPQANVSLFDFLTDKLPATISSSNTAEIEGVIDNIRNEQNSKDNSIKTYNTKAPNVGGNRFENNMSSSFAANRATNSTRSEDRKTIQSRSNTFNRKQEERNQQSRSKIEKGSEQNITNRTKSQTSNCSKIQNEISPVQEKINFSGSNNNNNNERNENPFRKDRDQTHRHSTNEYQANKRLNDYNKITGKKSRESNRNNQDLRSNLSNYQKKQVQKSNNFEKDFVKMLDCTTKLSIHEKKDLSSISQQSSGRNHQQTSGSNKKQQIPAISQLQKSENYSISSQQNSSQFADSSKSFKQNTKLTDYSPQLGNGFAYDPSKIIGFQSKEANEYAMNMLKSQGVTMQQLQQQHTVSPKAQQAAPIPPPPLQQYPQTQLLDNQASATVAYMTQNSNIFVAPQQQVPTQFGMIAGENWPWKEGDLCLAKYWDDGNYYNAKITAISEKTCVVFFLGYGNHEEVLKSDCVPITDVQHIPINAYQANLNAPSISQPPPAFQQRSNIHSGVGSGTVGNQRFRGERQMYVPPPKRNNN